MNIEEIKDFVYEVRTFGITSNDAKFVQITEYLLSELEKEKGENVKLRLQDIPLIEGELKAYKDRVNELKQELEKEKAKVERIKDKITHLKILAKIENKDIDRIKELEILLREE